MAGSKLNLGTTLASTKCLLLGSVKGDEQKRDNNQEGDNCIRVFHSNLDIVFFSLVDDGALSVLSRRRSILMR